eukprot:TRINITY_DN111084_c0_g1_i1.p1 TRINITY_DN111084_c0_g1~~TRINITY_DN111084_c0_g1_i1.p1  ORF type:complete len:810 (+),score=222.09 TRINITY_DN111084_c0_g1_i1:111-2540(+)
MAWHTAKLLGVAALALLTVSCDGTEMRSTSRMTAQMSARSQLRKAHREHEKRLRDMSKHMTVEGAVQVLHEQKRSAQLKSLLSNFRSKARAGRRSRSHGQLRASSQLQSSDDAMSANKMLNEMIQEVQAKYDVEMRKCCDYNEAQKALIEEARQDTALFNSEAAEARKEILQAQTQIELCQKKMPELNDALSLHRRTCVEETNAFRAQMKVIVSDLEVMTKILDLTQCKAPSAALLLVACTDECGQAVYSFQQDELRDATESLSDSEARRTLEQNLAQAYNAMNASDADMPDRLMKRNSPCKAPLPTDDRLGKCAVDSSPNCDALRDNFVSIQSSLEDKKDELEGQMGDLEKSCKDTTLNYQSQISELEDQLKDQQTTLAGATKTQNNAEESSRLKSTMLTKALQDFDSTTKVCHKNYVAFEGEECGLKKIRAELVKMASPGKTAFFQDCVVSEWLPGTCSKSCEGGTMTIRRSITIPPSGGADCPPLEAARSCNEQKCPIDCVLDDWSGWSSCTAKCGGGVMERQRVVRVQALHQGDPCGETTETQSCNVDACDKDCELGDWSGWSECSKACNTGSSYRLKPIVEPAVGSGTCPAIRPVAAPERVQWLKCNEQSCVGKAKVLECKATLDIILVLDGSGSLGQWGWDATQEAAGMLVKSFGDSEADINLAIQVFSTEIQWVQHFSTDHKKALAAVKTMQWPRQRTATEKALAAANSELSLGRSDAKTVVIVITDGRPNYKMRTAQAADQLKKKTRLLWVPVTRHAPLEDIKLWASEPVQDNVVVVDSFKDLEQPEAINEIIADVCPEVA